MEGEIQRAGRPRIESLEEETLFSSNSSSSSNNNAKSRFLVIRRKCNGGVGSLCCKLKGLK